MAQIIDSLPFTITWWHVPVGFGLFVFIVVLFQIIGAVDDPVAINIKIMRFNISSGFIKRPLKKLGYRMFRYPWDAFIVTRSQIGGAQYFVLAQVDNDFIHLTLKNSSPLSVRGEAGFTFQVWGIPEFGKTDVCLEHIEWRSPHDNIAYRPGEEFEIAIHAEDLHRIRQATNVRIYITGRHKNLQWR